MRILALTLLPVLVALTSGATPDYYWRSYENAKIPIDALIGTFDGQTVTYIGNVPIHGGGLYVGQIYNGNPNLTVSGKSDIPGRPGPVFTEQNLVQILCSGNRQRFLWVPTNSTSLHLVPDKVPGGYEGNPYGPLYIGRVARGQGIRIGKVIGYKDLEYQMLIPEDDVEIQYTKYEILVYDGSRL